VLRILTALAVWAGLCVWLAAGPTITIAITALRSSTKYRFSKHLKYDAMLIAAISTLITIFHKYRIYKPQYTLFIFRLSTECTRSSDGDGKATGSLTGYEHEYESRLTIHKTSEPSCDLLHCIVPHSGACRCVCVCGCVCGVFREPFYKWILWSSLLCKGCYRCSERVKGVIRLDRISVLNNSQGMTGAGAVALFCAVSIKYHQTR
jgi:hypothetical protein